MRERKKKGREAPEDRRSPEGVRIIPADEAQAALEAGQAAGRRRDDELRFGDVPPTPEGPRPTHRFPLPDNADPAEAVPRRPVISARRALQDRRSSRRTARIDPDAAHDPRPWDARVPTTAPGAEDPAEAEPTDAGPDAGAATEAPPEEPAPIDAGDGGDDWLDPEQPDDDAGAPIASTEDRTQAYRAIPSDPGGWEPSDDWRAWQDPEAPATGVEVGYGQAAVPSRYEPEVELWPAEESSSANPWPTGPASGGWAIPSGGWAEQESAEQGWDPGAPAAGGAEDAWSPDEDDTSSWVWPEDDEVEAEEVEPEVEPEPEVAAAQEPPPVPVPQPAVEPPASLPDDAPATMGAVEPAAPVAEPEEPAVVGDPVPAVERATAAAADAEDDGGPIEGDVAPDHDDDEGAIMAGPEDHDERDDEVDPPSLGLSVSGSTEMPHWTDPPTGEVLRIRGEEAEAGDDLKAWRALGANATRWRGDDDWGDDIDLDDLGDDETRVGAMDTSLSDQSDIYSFDKEFDALEEERSGTHRAVTDRADPDEDDEELDEPEVDLREPVAVGPGVAEAEAEPETRRVGSGPARPAAGGPGGGGGRGPAPTPPPPSGQRNLGQAITVGVILAALILLAALIGAAAVLVVDTVIVVACAIEAFAMLRRATFRPATLLGLVATAGVMFAAYWRGEAALPLVAAITFAATMLWYLIQVEKARPLANVAVTTMTWLWVGLLGSYAALLLRAHHGRGLFFGAIIPVIAADIVAFAAGRLLGRRPLASTVSPGKTIEGVVAGGVAALIAGIIIGKTLAPWGGIKHGILLGIVVALLAPTGDLFESMIKRDLRIKDSGSILPGHGGLLDRFDAVLLALPGAYYLAAYLHLIH